VDASRPARSQSNLSSPALVVDAVAVPITSFWPFGSKYTICAVCVLKLLICVISIWPLMFSSRPARCHSTLSFSSQDLYVLELTLVL